MTQFDESRRSFLAARDARQVVLERHLSAGGPSLVTVSLGVPGEDKTPPGSLALFTWVRQRLPGALSGAREVYGTADALGPFAIWTAGDHPAAAKEKCLAIEASLPAARLVDLDVYSPAGIPVDRASLHLPPRSCLCCDAPARECIRLSRHSWSEIESRAHALLASFGA